MLTPSGTQQCMVPISNSLLTRSLGRISDVRRNERFGENVEESFPCSADCKLIVVLGKLVRWSLVQGDPYGRGIVFVDYSVGVAF